LGGAHYPVNFQFQGLIFTSLKYKPNSLEYLVEILRSCSGYHGLVYAFFASNFRHDC